LGKRSNKFRFYLDENFPVPSGKFLKNLGHNVVHVVDNKITRSLSDSNQIKRAIKQNRIFLALDRDFLTNKSLHALISKSPGVILIKSSDPNFQKINEIIGKLIKKFTKKSVEGMICISSTEKTEFINPLELSNK
jgi:predicted nuclease of predicted toxin-antitoxin system